MRTERFMVYNKFRTLGLEMNTYQNLKNIKCFLKRYGKHLILDYQKKNKKGVWVVVFTKQLLFY